MMIKIFKIIFYKIRIEILTIKAWLLSKNMKELEERLLKIIELEDKMEEIWDKD